MPIINVTSDMWIKTGASIDVDKFIKINGLEP